MPSRLPLASRPVRRSSHLFPLPSGSALPHVITAPSPSPPHTTQRHVMQPLQSRAWWSFSSTACSSLAHLGREVLCLLRSSVTADWCRQSHRQSVHPQCWTSPFLLPACISASPQNSSRGGLLFLRMPGEMGQILVPAVQESSESAQAAVPAFNSERPRWHPPDPPRDASLVDAWKTRSPLRVSSPSQWLGEACSKRWPSSS